MRAALRCRLEKLEVRLEPKKPQFIRSGYLKTLPADYVGERHVVIVKRNGEWCEFEERPGPAPQVQSVTHGFILPSLARGWRIPHSR